jgi:hypothetical protein
VTVWTGAPQDPDEEFDEYLQVLAEMAEASGGGITDPPQTVGDRPDWEDSRQRGQDRIRSKYGRSHLQVQWRYNAGMATSTVGFAVADEDQERLARLVEHFGHGNRSAYLRATLPVMESLARAERLRELQARNAERAAAAGQDYESLLAEIRQAYKGGTPGQ